MPLARRKIGFTLIELLVVVAIIALLVSLLMPALMRAREQTRTVKCAANLRSIGLGFSFYRSDYSDFLPPLNSFVAYNANGTSKPYGMYNAIGPYLGNPEWGGLQDPPASAGDPYATLSTHLKYDSYWGSLKKTFPRTVWYCPSRSDATPSQPWYGTSYAESLYLQNKGGRGPDVSASNPRDWTFPRRYSQIPNPSAAIHLADSMNWYLGDILKVGTNDNFDLDRHNMNSGANMLFVDGHASFAKRADIMSGITRVASPTSMLNFQFP